MTPPSWTVNTTSTEAEDTRLIINIYIYRFSAISACGCTGYNTAHVPYKNTNIQCICTFVVFFLFFPLLFFDPDLLVMFLLVLICCRLFSSLGEWKFLLRRTPYQLMCSLYSACYRELSVSLSTVHLSLSLSFFLSLSISHTHTHRLWLCIQRAQIQIIIWMKTSNEWKIIFSKQETRWLPGAKNIQSNTFVVCILTFSSV